MGESSNAPYACVSRLSQFDSKIVIYADPADQARYDERRSRDLKAIQRMIEEDPNSQRLEAKYRDYQYVQPPEPDFKTMVEELTWLDQRDTRPVPTSLPPCKPLSFYQVSPYPASVYDAYRLPITHIHPPTLPRHTPPPHMAEYSKLRARLIENSRKYRALLSATECFCAGEWTYDDMDSIYDGVYQARTDCPRTIAAANFAVSSLESEKRRRKQLTLKRVIRANAQLLGRYGWIYWLTLEASNDKFYEAVVVVSSADHSERVLKYIRPAKYFPEIPAHVRHLWGPNS